MAHKNLYWGDIHNHNEVGCGQGSLERSYQIARSHLDFYAFTPHGQHAEDATDGLQVVLDQWPEIQRAASANYDPGRFTTFLAYEWHSRQWGDRHVVFLDDDHSMYLARTLDDLQSQLKSQSAFVIPHHIAYPNYVDWDLLDESLSPVIEIFSEHGCSERDFGLHQMVGHGNGPGVAAFTAEHGLARGKRFGFVAGTDNHDGHPGAYGLGLTGVRASSNTREAIFDAIRQRRTIAVTGDRIDVDLQAGDFAMGSVAPLAGSRELTFEVIGWDFLKTVELVRNNAPVAIHTPDYSLVDKVDESTYRVRVQWGWGPIAGYQVFDWMGSLTVDDGQLTNVVPNFCSDPFDEQRRKHIISQDTSHCRWQSHTSRGGIITTRNSLPACSPNDALCLEIKGDRKTKINLELHCQTRKSLLATAPDWNLQPWSSTQRRDYTIGQLLEGSQAFAMDRPPTWVKIHRAIPPQLYRLSGEYRPPDHFRTAAFYYLRVTQENGQMAWSSPIWFSE